MSTITWLHLADLYQKYNTEIDSYDRHKLLNALLYDIKNRVNISPCLKNIDFMVFSGDLAFSGQEKEYQMAIDFIIKLLEAANLETSQVIIVPGNHDLDRLEFNYLPTQLNQELDLLDDENFRQFIIKCLNDRRMLEAAMQPFNAYNKFVKMIDNDLDAYVSFKCFKLKNKKIMLLGFNSAWLCGRKQGLDADKGNIALGEKQIDDSFAKVEKNEFDIIISVMHHPFSWLREIDKQQVENTIQKHSDFILHGHEHKPSIVINNTPKTGQYITIPGGACYDKREHLNSYNFMHLDFNTGNGTGYFRRWSNENGQWLQDIEIANGNSNGEWRFSLKISSSPIDKEFKAPRIVICHSSGKLEYIKQTIELLQNKSIKQINLVSASERAKNQNEQFDAIILICDYSSDQWVSNQIDLTMKHIYTGKRVIAVFESLASQSEEVNKSDIYKDLVLLISSSLPSLIKKLLNSLEKGVIYE